MGEAAVMRLIPAHPNLLPLKDLVRDENCALLFTPFATGGDLLRFMQDRGCAPLPTDDVRSIFRQVVAGVGHMHSSGFVHRDLKCENVLLTGPNRRTVQLADFGFASAYQIGRKSLSEPWGSLHYSSPEICNQVSYEGPEVDVWSIGVVLYALCIGRLPFGGGTEEETAERIRQGIFTVPAWLPAELTGLIRGMLTVDVAKRFTLAQVAAHPWLAPLPPPPPPAAAAAAAPRISHRHASQAAVRLAEEPEVARRNSSPSLALPARLAQASKRVLHIFRGDKA